NAIKPATHFFADRFIKLSFHDEWDYAQLSYSFNPMGKRREAEHRTRRVFSYFVDGVCNQTI
ncbi:hypothetical protein, partial [Collinsella tanakaei]|uniref:hypothetical protein n=1 Tax=Collinsella tanakaei TaxID=626935 RepID=UPI00248DD305